MLADYLNYETIRWAARLCMAQGVIVFMLLLSMVSFSLPHANSVKPLFILIPIYYWSIYRPSLMPALYVFLLGLLVDFIAGFPVGLHSVLFVIAQLVIRSQRLFLMGQPYPMFWLGFAIVTSSIFALQWIFFSLCYWTLMPVADQFASTVLTILIFPVMALLLSYIQRILPLLSKSY